MSRESLLEHSSKSKYFFKYALIMRRRAENYVDMHGNHIERLL
jgi:hypothetical protein